MRLRKPRKPIQSAVRTRLIELVAERNLERARAGKRLITLTDISRETDVSFIALSTIAQNKAKTIAFDTMARLMGYFNLSSFDQLFAYIKPDTGVNEGKNNYEGLQGTENRCT